MSERGAGFVGAATAARHRVRWYAVGLVCIALAGLVAHALGAVWPALLVASVVLVLLFVVLLADFRRTTDALRDREFELGVFLDNTPAAIAMFDRDLRVLLVSRRWLEHMRLAAAEVVGKKIGEVLPIAPRWNEIHARCLAGAVERDREEGVRQPDGSVDWFSWDVRPWYAPSGQIGGLLTAGVVVNDRKRATDALRASEERWRSLVETLPEALFVHEDDRIVFVNRPAVELWRATSAEDLLGRSSVDLIHPDHRSIIEGLIADRTTPDKVVPLWETRIVTLDGTVVPVETTARVRMIDGHQIAQVLVRDVSQRKAVEEQLRFQDGVLRDIGRMAHVGGWTYEAASGRQYWTEEVPHLFDREPGAQMTIEDRLALFAGESRERIAGAVDGVLSHGVPFDVEVDVVTAAGNHKWIRSIGQPVVEDGRIVGIRAACQDVTDQHRASERIQRMNEELEARVLTRTAELQAANEELESFSYSVSHDLRAPLRTMDGFADMLQNDYGAALPADGVRCIRVIRESAQRMGALIDDLLAFSRLGREQIRPVEVDMHALVHQTLAELCPPRAERTVDVEVGEIRACRGDRALLKQVWTNLLSNALKYTRRRHTARIAVGSVQDAAGNPTYFVRDNGTGFDMRYADKMFGVFQRLHRFEDYEGTGVGLAIVHRVVQRHGGRVWCDAEEGRGATFFFTVGPQPPAVEDGAPGQPSIGAVSAA